MNCISKDELILFYYNELGDARQKMIEAHIEKCLACRKKNAALRSLLLAVGGKPLSIDSEEIVNIVKKVEAANIDSNDLFLPVKAVFSRINEYLCLKTSYSARLAFVSVMIFLALLVIPFTVQKNSFQAAAIDLQLELVSDSDDSDLWLDLDYFQQESQIPSSIWISS